MSKVLVILEVANGQIRPHSLPGITAGVQLAAKTGGELHLLVLGADPGRERRHRGRRAADRA